MSHPNVHEEKISARQLAERIVDDRTQYLPDVVGRPDNVLAIAWAIKEVGFDAWHVDPQRSKKAAHALSVLAGSEPHHEVRALAAWTAGIARIIDGDMAAAIAALDDAAVLFVSAGREVASCETQIAKIIALSTLGQHDDAKRCAQQIREVFIRHGETVLAGKVELNLGSMQMRDEKYADAAQSYRGAAVRFARAGDITRSITADIGLASALTWQHQFDEARLIHERARMRAERNALPVLVGLTHSSLGQLELFSGNYQAALHWLESWRSRAEAMQMPQRLNEAERDLADAYLAVNLLPEAITLYDRVIVSSTERATPIEAAWAYVQRGRALSLSGETLLALASLRHARMLFEVQGNHIGLGLVDLWEAELALAGADWTMAASKALRAQESFAHSSLDSWRLMAECTAAKAQLAAGDVTTAQTSLERTLKESDAHGFRHISVQCLSALGQLYLKRGDISIAESVFERAATLLEQQLAALPGDAFRVALRADHQLIYNALVYLAALPIAGEGADEDGAKVLAQIERACARSLLAETLRPEAAGHGFRDNTERKLRTRLNWVYHQLQEALERNETITTLYRQAASLEATLLETHHRRQVQYIDDPACRQDPINLQQLHAVLGLETALVEFFVLDDCIVICVVSINGVNVVRVPVRDSALIVQQCRFQIEALRHRAPSLATHEDVLLKRASIHLGRLHALLIAPVLHLIEQCTRLVIVPHAHLHYVPFAALMADEAPLCERYEIVTVPSATFLLRCAARPAARWQSALVVGTADATIPEVAREVDIVARCFAHAQRLEGRFATPDAVREAAAASDVIHLACHGRFRADSPNYSSLQLSTGAITVSDVQELRLSASLVTLSACETAISQLAPGDELIGLMRSFFIAGVPTLLASLWAVDDESTCALMTDFYHHLKRGLNPAAALRAAQRRLRKTHPHPYHWAAFSLHGRW
jgi:CHAT domain-containing protein